MTLPELGNGPEGVAIGWASDQFRPWFVDLRTTIRAQSAMQYSGLGAKLYSRWKRNHVPFGRVTKWKPTFMARMPYSGNADLLISSKCASPFQKSVMVSAAEVLLAAITRASSSDVLTAASAAVPLSPSAGMKRCWKIAVQPSACSPCRKSIRPFPASLSRSTCSTGPKVPGVILSSFWRWYGNLSPVVLGPIEMLYGSSSPLSIPAWQNSCQPSLPATVSALEKATSPHTGPHVGGPCRSAGVDVLGGAVVSRCQMLHDFPCAIDLLWR